MITRLVSSALLSLLIAVHVAAQTQTKPQEKTPDKAQTPSSALPTVDQILTKNVQAMGGKEALQKITTRTAKGTLEAPDAGINGKFEQYTKAPNKLTLMVDVGVAIFKLGFDGTKGWVLDPGSGLRDMSPVEIAESKIDADFYGALRMKERYAKLEVKEKTKVGDREAYIVEATPEGHKPDKIFFDAQTGLIIKTVGERDTPQGPGEVEGYLEDYRDVDGIKVPFTIRRITPAFSFTVKLIEVTHNATVDDAKFAKPTQ